jgi:sensor domain CHASE-containing protein
LVEFLNSRDPAWAEKYLKGRMDLYRIDMVWVLQADGTVVYGYNCERRYEMSLLLAE